MIAAGTRFGPYEIVGALGAGGMGEVYRARDTRLDRTVAIKVLAAHLSSSPELKQRFEREARTISSLNHPHICHLYDVGSQDGTDYLVMEFLEGETLAERLRKSPVSLAELLKIGIEVAQALDVAHRAGIIHRDLKPGNIMLTKGGAKLMDFGLAKPAALGAAGSGSAPLLSAARTTSGLSPLSPLTTAGAIVGTIQYMSPEQIEGKEADARSDIFAFGAVLYEMATGKRAFEGKSQISVASAILEKDPEPISSAKPMTPAALDHIVGRCLAKAPEERWQSAQDLKLELEWIRQAGSQAAAPAPAAAPQSKAHSVLLLAAALVLAVVVLATGYFIFSPKPAPATWANLNLAGELMDEEGNFTLSPDGQKIAYVAATEQGALKLWVRDLRSPKAQALDGTEGAEYPFWSPDSQSIAFFAAGKLKRIDASGERLQTICAATNARGGTWNRNDVILFTPDIFAGLQRVSAGGGTPADVIKVTETNRSDRWPYFLPDGRHFLFLSFNSSNPADNSGLFAGSLDSGDAHRVSKEIASNVAYVGPGYLLFVRDGKLMAQRFDLKQMQLTGEAMQLAEGVRYVGDRAIADFSTAGDSLIFLPPTSSGQQLVWFDGQGRQLGVAVPDAGHPSSGNYWSALLSPDAAHAAVERVRGATSSDIWIYDLKSANATRFSFADGQNSNPLWSPDGKQIAYESTRPSASGIYLKPAEGGGADRLLLPDVHTGGTLQPTSFSPDGRFLAVEDYSSGTKLSILPLAPGSKPYIFPPDKKPADNGTFSPDGKWFAYNSAESGRNEVYVVPFPGPGGKWQISTNGGYRIWWRGSGDNTEIYYLDPQSRLVRVPVRTQAGNLEVGNAQVLLGGRSLANTAYVDVTRDGQRILLGQPQPNASAALTLVLNWSAALKK